MDNIGQFKVELDPDDSRFLNVKIAGVCVVRVHHSQGNGVQVTIWPPNRKDIKVAEAIATYDEIFEVADKPMQFGLTFRHRGKFDEIE